MHSTIDPHEWPCACSALRMTSRAVSRHYEACLAPSGTTATQYSILRHLEREGPSPLRPLADALELERTSLYRAIAPLERDGLVELRSDPGDGRVKIAHLTRKGAARIQEVLPLWRQAQTAFLTAVGEGAWSEVSARLDDLRASMAHDPLLHAQIRAPEGEERRE